MRMGLEVGGSAGTDKAVAYCARVKPAIMKWRHFDARALAECRAQSPNTLHIGRIVDGHGSNSEYDRLQARILDKAREYGSLFDYWEGANEPIGDTAHPDDIRWLAGREVGLAQRLNAMGRGALIGGFSTGVLDDTELDPFAKAFEYAHAVGWRRCAIHSHEYGAGYWAMNVKTPDGRNQTPRGGAFTGFSQDPNAYWNPALTGWLCLRYRDIIPLLRVRGWTGVRLFITESGIDNTHGDPRTNAKGWKDSRGTIFENVPGLGTFAGQGKWYAWQLSHDYPHFIMGAVDFGFGDTGADWPSFRLDNEPEMFEAFQVRQLELPVGGLSGVYVPTPETRPPDPVPPVIQPRPTPPRQPAIDLPATVGADHYVTVAPRGGEGWAAYAGRMHGHPAADFNLRLGWAVEILAANGIAATRADVQAGRVPQPSSRGAWKSPWHRPEVKP